MRKGILKPETVESIMYVESFADEAGDSEVWLLESDTGNEYWLIEGAYPANIIRKSGIYQSAERAFAAYVEMLQEAYDFGTRIFGENKVQELTGKNMISFPKIFIGI